MSGPYVLGLLSARGRLVIDTFMRGCYTTRCPCCDAELLIYWDRASDFTHCFGEHCSAEQIVVKLGGEPRIDPWLALEEARAMLDEARRVVVGAQVEPPRLRAVS